MDVDAHLGNKEVEYILTGCERRNCRDEYQRDSKNVKFVRSRFVFAKTWRRRTWCLAKNRAKLSSKWVTWSSLNWRTPEFSAHQAYTMYAKERLFAHVANISYPTRRWYNVLKQLLKFSKHPTSVHLTWVQEVTSIDPKCGRNHHKAKDAQRGKRTTELKRRSGTDGKMMRVTESPI